MSMLFTHQVLLFAMAFLAALLVAVAVTPIAKMVAIRFGVMDKPGGRKKHKAPMPRLGGTAVFFSFATAILAASWFLPNFHSFSDMKVSLVFIGAGALLAFATGLWDDIKGARATYKLLAQIIAAYLAFEGGLEISKITLPWPPYHFELGWLALPATIFWFLIIINGINLIDGLDGLASGVTCLTCGILLVTNMDGGKLLVCVGFAALAGASLGFLRYNFHPASIFLGDSGSYFLGYMLAALTVMGSVKGQATVAILTPIIALGLPLFDSIFSAIRRFLVGKSIFTPDADHFHHKLINLGLNHRRAVLIFYGATACCGIVAILVTQVHDFQAAFLVLGLSAGAVLAMKRLGYMDYFGLKRLINWAADLGDDIGIGRDRRTFRGMQIQMKNAGSLGEFWENSLEIAEYLKMDFVRVQLASRPQEDKREACLLYNNKFLRTKDNGRLSALNQRQGRFYISIPMMIEDRKMGQVDLSKDLDSTEVGLQEFRRIEQLRRTLADGCKLGIAELRNDQQAAAACDSVNEPSKGPIPSKPAISISSNLQFSERRR